MSQEIKSDNIIKLLQERKAMEESDYELTKELFAPSSVVLPPIEKQTPIKCMQHDKPELLHRQRHDTIRVNKMEENNLKRKELSKKRQEDKKMGKKMDNIFGNCSDEYIDLDDKYI